MKSEPSSGETDDATVTNVPTSSFWPSRVDRSSGQADEAAVWNVPISSVHPGRWNPRGDFEEDGLRELARSIEAHGVLQPIVVREDDRGYSIIIGERRWRAAKLAGLEVIAASVRSGVTDAEAIKLAMVENLQRENLNPMDEAEGYLALTKIGSMRQKDIALAVRRSQGWISKMLQLLGLPAPVRDLIRSRELPLRHALALCKYAAYPDALLAMAQTVVEHDLTATSVEADLGTWGPGGAIGSHLIQRGMAVQTAYRADPCHGKACPFHARFGNLCLNPEAHRERVGEVVARARKAGDLPVEVR